MSAPVLIIGGGLAGLTAAQRLHAAGISFNLIEARDRLGGRILSLDANGRPADEGFDLGPSWFWPETQPAFGDFIKKLGLAAFRQPDAGDIMVQRDPGPVARYPAIQQEPASMRIAGGMAVLVAALAQGLPPSSLHLNTRAKKLTRRGPGVAVDVSDALGASQTMNAAHVLVALPPRLLAATVRFDPPLPAETTQRWQATPTWMAPHAKFVALYDRPFWRDAGLSGAARSLVGPLVEIHDATSIGGQAALFGFVGIPASQRIAAGEPAVVAAALRQLAQIFGTEAASPTATLYKDWAVDPLTATPDDLAAAGHPTPMTGPWVDGDWRDSLTLIGSETSRTEPGYLAGAVESAERGIARLLA